MKRQIKMVKKAAGVVLICSLIIPGMASASGFKDVKGKDAQIVQSLHNKGMIQGVTKDKFVPNGKLNGAQGVHLIVEALGLKGKDKSDLKFAGKSKWYTKSLQIAKDNGIALPENFTVNGELTREEFAYILRQGIDATGNYPLIKMYIHIQDADQGNILYSGSIQNLVLMKIATLDSENKFYPTKKITRMEAAQFIYNAVNYIDQYKNDSEIIKDSVIYNVEKVNDDINKVTLTRENQPSPGYGITVSKVEFTKGGVAKVYYELLSPEPGQMYPQVITSTKTVTYVSSQYKVELVKQ